MTLVTPSSALDHLVAQHGDTLYRIALLLSDNSGQAAQALRRTVQQAARDGSDSLPGLLRLLLQTLDQQRQARRWPWQRTRSRRFSVDGPLYRGPGIPSPFGMLPFEQRRILALHMLMGYDAPRLGEVLGENPDQARDELVQALEVLAETSGMRLPSAVTNDDCLPVRAMLMRAPDRLASDPLLRGHLALCSLCRAFDATWNALGQQAETAVRNGLRNHALPRDLANALAAIAKTAGQQRAWWEEVFAGGKASFVIVPLVVLALIGALVLPGFLSSRQQEAASPALSPADGRSLVQKALALVGQPPANGRGVWHAQWETIWYFPNGSYAPIVADAWLDSANPARHRIQAVHGGGGALYELQVGDGKEELWYALGATYASSLYGAFNTPANQPQLVRRAMDPAAQQAAAQARLRSGLWNVGAAYLRAAYSAPDLRTLGRQPLGDKTVQIVRFVAPSPLGLPTDDPEVKPVTILLGLDITDGRLRLVTEFAGPANGEQTSRVTWRLQSEEWLQDAQQIQRVFDARQAWNGRGVFPSKPEGTSAHSALLLYETEREFPLEQLFADELLAPDMPPPGADHLITQHLDGGTTPVSSTLTYLGEGKQLALTWQVVTDTSKLQAFGANLGLITPARNEHYHGLVVAQNTRAQPALGVVIDAQGFTRAEVSDFMSGMQPLRAQSWINQQMLVASSHGEDSLLRDSLVRAVGTALRPSGSDVVYRRERLFTRLNKVQPTLSDPYHAAPNDGYPETAISEQWIAANDAQQANSTSLSSFRRLRNVDGTLYSYSFVGNQEDWSFQQATNVLQRFPHDPAQKLSWRSERWQAAYRLMLMPQEKVAVSELADGAQTISATTGLRESVFGDRSADLEHNVFAPNVPSNVTAIITELTLDAEKSPVGLRYSAVVPNSAPLLLMSWELEEERIVSIDAAPPELRSSEPPVGLAVLINDYGAPLWSPIRTATISEALTVAPAALYLLPGDHATTLGQLEMSGTGDTPTATFSGDALDEAIRRNIAMRITYYVNNDWRQALRITEGPAVPLQTYLRTLPPSWVNSKPMRVTVAGQERDGWLLEGSAFTTNRLIVQIDDTLMIVEGNASWFDTTAIPLLADLQKR